MNQNNGRNVQQRNTGQRRLQTKKEDEREREDERKRRQSARNVRNRCRVKKKVETSMYWKHSDQTGNRTQVSLLHEVRN